MKRVLHQDPWVEIEEERCGGVPEVRKSSTVVIENFCVWTGTVRKRILGIFQQKLQSYFVFGKSWVLDTGNPDGGRSENRKQGHTRRERQSGVDPRMSGRFWTRLHKKRLRLYSPLI